MYRVFLVEDSLPIRERVAELLGSIKGIDTVGAAGGASDAEQAILATRPDAVLLDIRLAQGSGFDVLRSLRSRAPEIEIYVFSNFSTAACRQLASNLGARGFFDKTTEIDRLRQTMAERAAQSMH